MLAAMRSLKPQQADSRDGLVILTFEDESGEAYEVALNSIEAAHFMGVVRTAIEEAVGHPMARSYGLPGMTRVQYVETPETEYFRVFVTDRVYHEYPVPRDTTLADDLKAFADRVEARNLAKATHRPPEGSAS